MKTKGMTFMEILIAILIISIILSSILTSLNFASKYARHNANKTMALNYAQALMEEIKDVGFADLDGYDGYTDNVLIYQDDGVNMQTVRNVEVEDDEENFRDVTVTISWDWLSKSYSEEISTLRYNY